MIFDARGLTAADLYVTGLTWSPVYLLAGRTPILFEAGFSPMAGVHERDIRQILPSTQPEHLFLTHVHWDHCGGASHLKRAFPGLKICASDKARKILQRENAVRLISSLSEELIPLVLGLPDISATDLLTTPFEPFQIDIAFEEEQRVTVDSETTVEVLFTPGHTRDMLSYYVPERRMLFATESAGCMGRNGIIVPEFLVDYDAYLSTIRRFLNLEIDTYCQGHHYVFTGPDVRTFLERSLERAQYFKSHIESLLHDQGLSIDDVVALVKAEEYDSNPKLKQPERAYLLNLRTQVAHLAARLKT